MCDTVGIEKWSWFFLSFRKPVTIQNEFYYTNLVGQSGLDGKVRKRKSFPLNTQCWSWRRELWLETGNTGVCKRCNKLRSETSSRWKTGFVARSMPAPGCSLELISSDFFSCWKETFHLFQFVHIAMHFIQKKIENCCLLNLRLMMLKMFKKINLQFFRCFKIQPKYSDHTSNHSRS